MSFLLKLRQNSIIRIALVAALLAAPLSSLAEMTDPAAPDARTSLEVATSEFFDTVLTVTPQNGYYQKAVLRVSGPGRYSLTEHFEDNAPISVDLLADWVPLNNGRGDNARSSRLNRLPVGHYSYEVVFADGSGRQQVHADSFRIP